MKKVALFATVLFASTASFAGTITNNCAAPGCSVSINGSAIAKGASASVAANDTVSINGKPTKISTEQAAKDWQVGSKGQLEAKAGGDQSKNAAGSAAPSATPASAAQPAAGAPKTSNQ